MEDFIDKVVVKLRRQYSKDELVEHLNKEISKKDILIGQLNSEILFLEKSLKDLKDLNKEALIQVRKEELYQNKLIENKNLIKKNKKLSKDNNDLIYQLCQKNKILQEKGIGIKEE